MKDQGSITDRITSILAETQTSSKRPNYDTAHLFPTTVEINNAWSFTPTPRMTTCHGA